MRAYQDNFFKEMIIDNFAGGGGTSTALDIINEHLERV
jgi:aspartate ammonia-lyase